MKTRRKKQTQRHKNLITRTSGVFVIVVTNNSLNDSLPFKYLKDLSDNLQILEILDKVTQFDIFYLFFLQIIKSFGK